MTKKQFAVALVVLFVGGVVGGLLSGQFGGSPAHADITWEQFNAPYRVQFGEWVPVWMAEQYESDQDDWSVLTGAGMVGDKIRFSIVGRVMNTPMGRQWYETVGSQIEETVAMKCDLWTKAGYPISINDFDIDIQKLGW